MELIIPSIQSKSKMYQQFQNIQQIISLPANMLGYILKISETSLLMPLGTGYVSSQNV